ncbi:transcription factor BIM1-like isoform X2 [Tripterygium wilfordii]|uniref:transcription factor BIM1-like isoform X2 n=1 Tax=Tripterygium wilfordii TaxID=458696 RepID=UPI0018F7ED61|nr:transcription factor BIM1-like isoform X2 [Tripterygium wilfordii]
MELPQSRPYNAEGRKPTHDFLSLYSHSTAQQDPRPPSQGNDYLKTKDFLQPLEMIGKGGTKEETAIEISSVEKRPPPALVPPSVEHILPGGIGTYSINHISYYNPKAVPKPEGTMFDVAHQASSTDKNEENSNCSSYTGSGFTLWEESSVKKGKTGKENAGDRTINVREAGSKVGHGTTSERLSQSSANNHHNTLRGTGQKSQSFVEMIKSAKLSSQDDELEEEEEFILKQESPTPPPARELRVKVDGKTIDQKVNTPRSKHSATEQRRRSKINDRFVMLREIIPNGDQKRDKASFLLEVIEYIQFLQEKVNKYEGPYQGWNHESTKLEPWRNGNRSTESYAEQSRSRNSGSGPALFFSPKLDEISIAMSQTIPGSAHKTVDSDLSSATAMKAIDHYSIIANKDIPFPMSLQPHFLTPLGNGTVATQLPSRMASDAENQATQPAQSFHTRSNTGGTGISDKLKEEELAIEGGTISISSVYSRGLLNTLTQALQSSGVDLSGANISVQIELGKQASGAPTSSTPIAKDEVPSSNLGTIRSRVVGGECSDPARKKLKTGSS